MSRGITIIPVQSTTFDPTERAQTELLAVGMHLARAEGACRRDSQGPTPAGAPAQRCRGPSQHLPHTLEQSLHLLQMLWSGDDHCSRNAALTRYVFLSQSTRCARRSAEGFQNQAAVQIGSVDAYVVVPDWEFGLVLAAASAEVTLPRPVAPARCPRPTCRLTALSNRMQQPSKQCTSCTKM